MLPTTNKALLAQPVTKIHSICESKDRAALPYKVNKPITWSIRVSLVYISQPHYVCNRFESKIS
jgi:hypothetical protein